MKRKIPTPKPIDHRVPRRQDQHHQIGFLIHHLRGFQLVLVQDHELPIGEPDQVDEQVVPNDRLALRIRPRTSSAR